MFVTKELTWVVWRKKATEVNGYRQLVIIFQNILFCVQQKKETHTGLE